ncbi:GntR family transcriptional regulator [Chitinophaga cymbidii]|uniref:Transcriptional regulator n=1 Tax=Chitinophaga cymbidii TaxID=1096750 RepID=A0A512RPF9_9BACT|nr:GntR family transcriptional regulator [Chitinophaga cymbidii]GEP97588.1 transcriptional regulator [Chitinophaga cymbidii]
MQDIYEQIRELEHIQGLSKHEQLVQGIINAINDKLIQRGDMLPSVNNLIKELGFARETIAKGYKELVSRGIVESKNRIGFYVARENTENNLRIALVIFAFDSFQEVFFKTFRDSLGTPAYIDIYFHHNNIDVLESTIASVRGRYGMYVVAPIPHKRTAGILSTLPMNKFLMIDRYQALDEDFSYVVQEFGKSSYAAFSKLAPAIRKFRGMIHYHRPASDTPIEIIEAYKKFVKDFKIKSVIRTEYIPGSIEKGYVYFTINNAELWQMLKDAKAKGFRLGKDVGVLSHNDEVVKEIIFDGITTYSTDFAKMAEKAAEFVLKREKIQEVIPTVLLRRGSL